MWSAEGEMQVCIVKDIRSRFLAGRSTEKCLTRVFPRALPQRVPVSKFCFSHSPHLAPCAYSLGTAWRCGSKAEGQQEAAAFPVGSLQLFVEGWCRI